MHLTPETVARQREWLLERSEDTVTTINTVREELGAAFDVTVQPVGTDQYEDAVIDVFADDRGVNVAAYVGLLRDLDVQADYPGFVVDEYLGRRLAATIAGGEPLTLLAEATFHYVDVRLNVAEADATAGMDDLEAGLVAGFQTRLPGWAWREEESPFADSE